MKHSISLAALALTATVALTSCSDAAENADSTGSAPSEHSEHHDESSTGDGGGHDMQHPAHGGPAPEGITVATDPTYPVGSQVILTADHMPGMDGAEATISGAFDTTTYSISYTPVDGGEPVTDHRWVVHEELVDPGEAPLPDGAEVALKAEHMPGMKGAEATIDYSTDETVYMVDLTTEDMTMTNHKWVTESEIQPAE
ncbi:YdhK family protein [Corynebacterium sp. A21]|uniref:YdhK family protein n=1 Tax=Corynebacterium sp. A21 TaxID=3457318 RepID=UPI003FD4ED1A